MLSRSSGGRSGADSHGKTDISHKNQEFQEFSDKYNIKWTKSEKIGTVDEICIKTTEITEKHTKIENLKREVT